MSRVLAVSGLVLLACAGPRAARRGPALEGKPISVLAEDLDGREVRIEADQGKVRVVDLFASWCEPCRDQFPALERLSHAYRARGLVVYAVSFDEDRAALETFVAEHGPSFPVLWDPGGSRLAPELQIRRLPTTLVVDRRGVIRSVHLGFEPAEEARLERDVRRLLGER
ncbi:MAG TPA: TlpA disulfide reductase family protein [Methylomirabilota bacterium]|nr:TlpA disulfide reductase family protein [Methylomirabilota bacterium]